jgi:hypothetical protein
MSKRFIITEDEKNHIKKLYGLLVEINNTTSCTFTEKSNTLPDYNEIISKYGNDVNKVSEVLTTKANEIIQKVPQVKIRTACQVALNAIREKYKNKPWLIIDQVKNTVYFFDNGGTYLTGTLAIMGKDKPTKEFEDWSKMSYDERVKSGLGDPISREGGRFAPSGVYQTGGGQTYTDYTGAGTKENPEKNLWSFLDSSGKELTQAIHGVKGSQERLNALKSVKGVDLSKETNVNLDLSSGCINLPTEFLTELKAKNIDIVDYFVFIIKSDATDYFVKNPSPLKDSEKCHSPESLNAEQIT